MRLFFIVIITIFLTISMLLGTNYITNNFNFQISNNSGANDQNFKIITVTIKIKDNLPIRKDLNLKTKYYFRLLNKKVSLISLINKINLATENFDILAQNLNLEIDSNYILILTAKRAALEIYNRNTITYEALVNIGLKDKDANQILNIFHDLTINLQDLETKLKAILATTKRKYLRIIKEFVVF